MRTRYTSFEVKEASAIHTCLNVSPSWISVREFPNISKVASHSQREALVRSKVYRDKFFLGQLSRDIVEHIFILFIPVQLIHLKTLLLSSSLSIYDDCNCDWSKSSQCTLNLNDIETTCWVCRVSFLITTIMH